MSHILEKRISALLKVWSAWVLKSLWFSSSQQLQGGKTDSPADSTCLYWYVFKFCNCNVDVKSLTMSLDKYHKTEWRNIYVLISNTVFKHFTRGKKVINDFSMYTKSLEHRYIFKYLRLINGNELRFEGEQEIRWFFFN